MVMFNRFATTMGLGLLCGLAMTAGGCTDTAPVQQEVARAAKVKAVRAPTQSGLIVRAVGDHYEIEVRSPSGFPPAGLDPILHVGTATFVRYRYSASVGFYGAVYAVSAAELATLVDGAEVYVDYGRGGGREQFGTFNRSMVQ